jgi:beta-ribofuranosylaminobenzene 5'-phosphate synthase
MPVAVATPCRLHFGLLRFEQDAGRSFGGLGLMLQTPRTVVEVEPSARWSATGPNADRALSIAQGALVAVDAAKEPAALRIAVAEAIPAHRGLGAGTQLACAVAAAVRAVVGLPPASAEQLARLTGRGRRSAVGCHGFVRGGLIWELGRRQHDLLGQLKERIETPSEWRVALVTPLAVQGLSGQSESIAFDALPTTPETIAHRLAELAEQHVLPAARRADLAAFGEAIYEYGRLAGECFAPVQGGCYASPQIAECVAAIRDLGVPGAGQSSWGPTVFAVTANEDEARRLVDGLASRFPPSRYDLEITAPNNSGAAIEATPI